MKENVRQTQTEGCSTKNLSNSSQNYEGHQIQESGSRKNYHRPEEAKES